MKPGLSLAWSGPKLPRTAELSPVAGPIKGPGRGSQTWLKGQPAHGFLRARTQSAPLVSSFGSLTSFWVSLSSSSHRAAPLPLRAGLHWERHPEKSARPARTPGWQVESGPTWVCEPGAAGLRQAVPSTDDGRGLDKQSLLSKPQFTPL